MAILSPANPSCRSETTSLSRICHKMILESLFSQLNLRESLKFVEGRGKEVHNCEEAEGAPRNQHRGWSLSACGTVR